MKLSFNDGKLIITPETDEDKIEIKKAIGDFEAETDIRNYREATGENVYGFAVYLADDGISAEFRVKDAWWNYDD